VISGPTVVDASVVVEYLIELQLTAQATRFFGGLVSGAGDLELWAPDLIFAEATSALRKLVRRRAISDREGLQGVQRLTRLPIIATGTAGLLPAVWKLREVVTAYDACYLALAVRLDAPMITADARLARVRAGGAPKVIFLGDL
jgi:predicted nucleic acid-binding protein